MRHSSRRILSLFNSVLWLNGTSQNGTKILETKNMLQTYVVPVKPSASNTLVLHSESAAKLARELKEHFGQVRAGSTNLGDLSRVYVRNTIEGKSYHLSLYHLHH